MSYLYDKLKEALGGDRLTESKNTVINDWSPNSIRVLIISRNAIITVNHLGVFGGCTKKVDLDVNLVARDLDEVSRTNYGKPKLNVLLSKRSFSCLEELYVDAMFMNYPRVLDLVGYVKDMMNSNSRLRYFGYGDFSADGLREYLNNSFKEAYSKKDFGYSLAKDTGRPCKIEYKDLGNADWYKKYYLRPQYYKKDRQGGDLDIHFKKIEDGYDDYISRKESDSKQGDMREKVMSAVSKDVKNTEYLMKIDKMLSYLAKCEDNVGKLVFSSMKKVLLQDRKIDGLTKNMLDKFDGDSGIIGKYLMGCYEKYGVLDKSRENTLGDISKYVNGDDGFIPVGSVLDSICCDVCETLPKRGYGELIGMAVFLNAKEIPEGEFFSKYVKKDMGSGRSYEGYINFLSEVIGKEI